jgi:N6-L-threonylcarbamoyladenine synthase
MIGAAASIKLRNQKFASYELNGNPGLDLEQQ